MDGRTCDLLTERDVARSCFFEFVFITEDIHVFAKAWRKQIKPVNSLDNSGYTRANDRYGEWTIQVDGWFGDRHQSAYTSVKENRSDAVCMHDLNAHLTYTREHFPDVPSYFFRQEYADCDYDRKYSFARVLKFAGAACGQFLAGRSAPGPGEVRFLAEDERIAVLRPSGRGNGYWKLDDGSEVVVLKPGTRV